MITIIQNKDRATFRVINDVAFDEVTVMMQDAEAADEMIYQRIEIFSDRRLKCQRVLAQILYHHLQNPLVKDYQLKTQWKELINLQRTQKRAHYQLMV